MQQIIRTPGFKTGNLQGVSKFAAPHQAGASPK